MKILGVREFVEAWDVHSKQPGICVAGSILHHKDQLLLLDEGRTPGFYKGNARLVVDDDRAALMLRHLLPHIGGGPSLFWEAAVVEVCKAQKRADQHVVSYKRIHYWDALSHTFVVLKIDDDIVTRERAADIAAAAAGSELAEAGEIDPFSAAGNTLDEYWADKL